MSAVQWVAAGGTTGVSAIALWLAVQRRHPELHAQSADRVEPATLVAINTYDDISVTISTAPRAPDREADAANPHLRPAVACGLHERVDCRRAIVPLLPDAAEPYFTHAVQQVMVHPQERSDVPQPELLLPRGKGRHRKR